MVFVHLFLCFLCCLALTRGIKVTYTSEKSGIYGDFLVNDFGMAVGGIIEVDYSVAPKDITEPFDSYLVLLILSSDQKDSWYGGLGDSDNTVTKNINTLCNQPAMLRKELIGSGSVSFDINYAVGTDRYSVALLQCRTSSSNNPISVDITLVMKNARPDSVNYSHFPIEQVMEVRVLEGELIVYALLILGMCGQLYVAG